MRALMLAVVLAAAPVGAAEKIDEVDQLRAQVAALADENAQLRAQLAAVQNRAMVDAIRAKYKLSDGDAVDPKTLEIRRAPKPKK